ncbi:alginate lyase domain-containing protein [Jimgerdemannia flammicorona]|uniref:Alginate lyase domain-containing protein n=2 Tax=Jimgerdemannia flammicorona TaxID=994334 RepID=A0A433Q3J8_9FUNG|nr:alginate lyase domain-containing protein [Jimgerdemannia flammicorona]RUS24244.1 alginate lyase domain-containing protein [Jimgerdemannia flammicorona]
MTLNPHFQPPSGDKRDWLSYAPYWSPDPNCPTAKTEPEKCPYVKTDGVTNPDIYNLTSESDTEAMASAVKVLSMAFYLFDEEKYAARAAEVLRMWFLNNQTRFVDFNTTDPVCRVSALV